jgi:hypothetical protein
VNANINTNVNISTNLNTNTGSTIPADWKTYSNAKWKFSFRYPIEWNTFIDKLPNTVRESLPDEMLRIGGAEKVENGISYPSLKLYVNPMGWGTNAAHKVITVHRESGLWTIVSEQKGYTEDSDSFPPPTLYTVRLSEDESYSNRLYVDITSSKEIKADAQFDELVSQIISTFTFTE